MKSLVLPAVFPSSSIFFDADITILQGWATYASVHSWLTHSLCSGLFLIGWYSVCYSLNSSQACLALALLFFTDFRTDVSPLCRHLDLLFFLIITGLLVSHFHNRFLSKQSSFSSAKIVCRRERHGCLDQWRSRFNLPLSSLRFYLWLKIKRIDALSLVHPLNDIYFLGSVKIDLITSKSNST